MAIFLCLILFKVFHHRLEHLDIVVTRDVSVKTAVDTLRVSHLTEDASVGRGDTLYRESRAVGVIVDTVGSVAVEVNVLRSYLTVLDKLAHSFLGCQELTLSVRDRNVINVADLR